ncbi:MAG: flagellar biosynthetic protein FliR [Vampirovibrionales bacterium]|nr:flagellar biosynthetic protein FliR [Vampirovibrionales bacterium]
MSSVTAPVADILTWFNISSVLSFALVLFRVSGLTLAGPVFGESGIPAQVKVTMTLGLAVLFYAVYAFSPAGQLPRVPVITDLWEFSFVAGLELLVGLFAGYMINLVFYAVRGAGEMMALQMGLNASALIDPLTRQQQTAVTQLLFLTTLMIFLSVDGHHQLLGLLDSTFNTLPIGFAVLKSVNPINITMLSKLAIDLTQDMLILAISLAMPAFGAVLVAEVGMAFVAKLMPQMNVFIVGIPVKLVIGFSILYFSGPSIAEAVLQGFGQMLLNLGRVI